MGLGLGYLRDGYGVFEVGGFDDGGESFLVGVYRWLRVTEAGAHRL